MLTLLQELVMTLTDQLECVMKENCGRRHFGKALRVCCTPG